MPRLFGTDGVRGEVNREPMLPENIFSIGRALATYWNRNTDKKQVVVGHDGRLSASMLEQLLGGALQSCGFKVYGLGLCSTPALSFLTRLRGVAGGIMISASHNPFYDNGIKPFSSGGEKFTEGREEEVEGYLFEKDFDVARRAEVGTREETPGWLSEYVEALSNKSIFYPGRILVDCANGGTSKLAPHILADYCNSVVDVNTEPDGTNINRDCGSLNVEKLRNEVHDRDVDLGFAFDGDGDRVLAVDEQGEVVDGDVLMYMLARFREIREPDFGGLVMTVMSNLGLRKALAEKDIDFKVVSVGDRNVYNRLSRAKWQIGGEQSGHIIDRDWLPTGDGLRTLVMILKILQESEKKLCEWNSEVPDYPQVLKNFEIPAKPPLEELDKSADAIEAAEAELGDEGRILVRYSGTEPLVRVMLEGRDKSRLQDLAAEVGESIVEEVSELKG